jgi:hypothetical protein
MLSRVDQYFSLMSMDLALKLPPATPFGDGMRDETPPITGVAAQSQSDSENEVLG